MAKFEKGASKPKEERYSIGINIVLSGSKKLTDAEKEALLSTEVVSVLLADARDEKRVLLQGTLHAKEFSTGNVGFGLNVRNTRFSE